VEALAPADALEVGDAVLFAGEELQELIEVARVVDPGARTLDGHLDLLP
jgi:hypothetical protein